jgi:lysophospholipase L1-like esterase
MARRWRLLLALLAGVVFLMGPEAPAQTPKKAAVKKKTVRRRAPARPPVTAAQKAVAQEKVQESLAQAAEAGIDNPAALVPFFEQLYRLQESGGDVLRVLQFGDSHTASDDWPAAVRARFQASFGNGGPGFVHAGRPFLGFRRWDAKSSMSRGWSPSGLLNRTTDGRNGLAGVSLTTARAGETLSLEAEGARVEVFYYQQPGGGSFTLKADEEVIGVVETAGEEGPGFFAADLQPGSHRFELRTAGGGPVRLFGWAVENEAGVTWETLGINGAQADLLLLWDEELLRSHIERRNPALIVLAYGTNEARRRDWTAESYAEAFGALLDRLRAATPTASLLVLGPPDQYLRLRSGYRVHEGVDRIVEAQRMAALARGCAFWDLRTTMGGKGSMRQWVNAGFAQGDFVHFTAPGYRMIGESLYELIMGQYGAFSTLRREWTGSNGNGSSSQD